MANGPRTIYSRRQRLAPGQYDTPLADFLRNLPDYFNQYQQNQLALERQKIQTKRYEDAQKQQEFRNDISLANLLDGSSQTKFLKSSKDPRLQNIGNQRESSENTFQEILNSGNMSESDIENINFFKESLNDPNIRGNKERENQIKSQIKTLQDKSLLQSLESSIGDREDNVLKIIMAKGKSGDVSGAYEDFLEFEKKTINRKRKTAKGRDNVLRYVDDGTPVFRNIPMTATPSAQVEYVQTELKEVRRSLRTKDKNSKEYQDLLDREKDLVNRADVLSGINNQQSDLFNNNSRFLFEADPSPAESSAARIKIDY